METSTLTFIRRGQPVSLGNVPPERTLLEVLREDLGATGTKEGCGEGDCGACTVVIGEIADAGNGHGGSGIRYRAINSCIRLAHSIDGMALWTVEDIVGADGTLHPAQEAMVRCHGSQCGFCTPGFVMSLFGMYQNHVVPALGAPGMAIRPGASGAFDASGASDASNGSGASGAGAAALPGRRCAISRELAQEELSGNLCRCTGYRPIFDAAQQMEQLPPVLVDEAALARQLRALQTGSARTGYLSARPGYVLPRILAELLVARAADPQAQIVAGCTDVGLWVTKMHRQFERVLDVTQVRELLRIEHYDHHIAIGAAVTLTDAFAALVDGRPQLKVFGQRFAGLPVRNSGTLGGNIANGSPIGDSMPLLIALGAQVVLMSVRGHRELPMEDFYTGYRKNLLAPDEVLAWIKVPRPAAGEFLRAYKISKRFDDDISAVCLVLNMTLADGRIDRLQIGAGGVAATPVRAVRTEAFLRGKPWTEATALEAARVLRGEFQPISDMRASADYRSEVLGNLLRRFWLESQGAQHINLESVIPQLEPQAAGSSA